MEKQKEMYESRVASLSQLLVDQEREYKAEIERQSETCEARIASLSQSLVDQEKEHKAERERQQEEFKRSLLEQERETERVRELCDAYTHSLSQQLSDCQPEHKRLSDSLTVSQDMCRRLAKEVIQMERDRLKAQVRELSPIPPQRKRPAVAPHGTVADTPPNALSVTAIPKAHDTEREGESVVEASESEQYLHDGTDNDEALSESESATEETEGQGKTSMKREGEGEDSDPQSDGDESAHDRVTGKERREGALSPQIVTSLRLKALLHLSPSPSQANYYPTANTHSLMMC
ncbi:hypothetical protein KIPB_007400 [Kipferlia bialata]|uniref:Uncharacterized protein n=1 Tax=Kipferlia bialata TaxID=797122 RepID=A0A9K3D149_9EUKA|nr:hypothetical protein KIPB_007400 [Kipferlia bialata]|eukprot:g7400.t1